MWRECQGLGLPGMDWAEAIADRASAETARWIERMMWVDHEGW